jgi:hypothetical protein
MACGPDATRYTCEAVEKPPPGEPPVKKGRHRRFEEARAMKRSQDVDFDALLDSLQTDRDATSGDGWDDDLDDEFDDDDED